MDFGSFDYVVIGGGTTGLALATRLVEDPVVSVCVLEAGFAFKNLGKPNVDWGFFSTPQAGAKGRSLYLPRGKGLGGSSLINLMTLGRGHWEEYDAFQTLGSPGWNWESLIEYFRKSETFAPTAEEMSKLEIEFNPAAHGTSGPLQRTLPKWINAVQAPFIEGMKSLGVPYNPDSASGNNTGMWISNHSIDSHGARSSSASAYYSPNQHNSHLTVITSAQATRILFSSSTDASGNLVASGVEYRKNGQAHTVSAAREVLLCVQVKDLSRLSFTNVIPIALGTFKTPQLLELSGIGDKTVLEAHGVDMRLELPGVGKNLRSYSFLLDHFWSPFVSETNAKYESAEVLKDPARAAQEWQIYEKSKTGMLSGTCSTLYSFLTMNQFMGENYAITEQMHTSLHPSVEVIQKQWLGANEIPFLEVVLFPGFLPIAGHKPEDGKSYSSIFLALTHPFSSGTVHIASSDPLAAPAINHQVLDNEVDLNILVNAVKFARKLATTPSLSAVFTREVLPGAGIQTDDEIKDYIRSTVDTVFHPIGTASMLPRELGGVVDPSLKVYGTSNLRVVDASIIPIHLSAHIQATVYAIAEKVTSHIRFVLVIDLDCIGCRHYHS
ncbi:GMC oxidoreductase [Mycena sanguinolenta]|uniref:GMC oxidoreductase n=1 Tax=Mycena sanguinolenta TaxID=230812 RepID=A0A8H6XIB5_9AGAR|nr:GMC oxidoreductase [Mycena sanguinolenta]